MRFLFLSAIKDLRLARREPLAIAVRIATPLIVSGLLVAFFGREQPKPQGLVLIADQDKSFLSALVLHAYTQDKLGDIFTVQQVPLDEGRRRIHSGDGSALLIIPKGFSKAVLGQSKATVQLITNPAESILPGMVESVTSILVEAAWRVQQLMGDDLRRFSNDVPPSDEDIASSSIRYSHLGTDARKYLDPPVINLKMEKVDPNPGRSRSNLGQTMFPSMTFLTILFLVYGMAMDIWKEKAQATLRHVAVTPGSIAGFLGGKVLTVWLILFIVSIVAFLSGKLLIGVEIHAAVAAVLWIVICGGTLYMLFLLLDISCPSERSATTFSNLLVFPLSMLGGAFFPFELMPRSLADIGSWTPNGRSLIVLTDILAARVTPAGLAVAFGAAFGSTIILFLLIAWRLRRKFIF